MIFDCLDCPGGFLSGENLIVHCSEAHHRFGCKSCSKRFFLPSALAQHIQNSSAHHSGSGEGNLKRSTEKSIFFCAGCDCLFVNTVAFKFPDPNSSKYNLCFACARDQVCSLFFPSPTTGPSRFSAPLNSWTQNEEKREGFEPAQVFGPTHGKEIPVFVLQQGIQNTISNRHAHRIRSSQYHQTPSYGSGSQTRYRAYNYGQSSVRGPHTPTHHNCHICGDGVSIQRHCL
ncbi:hypothetical protein BDZ94DRAFT_1055730 [Collybia nuda]|uniref:C2H2-type domain-containing protein n=1 Tax=Collybia nuda TaxID=64659 RepID=A0A9P5XYZ0_9AGAR|nr:hypothetical protein BDZ94DRAFT_1055730 [Collybia nuda]